MLNRKFQDDVQRIIKEKTGNEGIEISPGAFRIHDRLVDTYLQGLPESYRYGSSFHPDIDFTVRFVRDAVRTVTMMRAVNRILQERMRQKDGEIHVIEAGSGIGFLAAAAAAVDERVIVSAYERSEILCSVSQKCMKALGLGDRVKIHKRDLLEEPLNESADCVIAEHIMRGCLNEAATDIARSIRNIDPHLFVPFSVKPNLVFGIDVQGIVPSTHLDDGEHAGVIYELPDDIRTLQFLYGDEVVLADPSASDLFSVHGKAVIQPGRHVICVGNDVRWLSGRFDPAGAFDENFEESKKTGKPTSELVGPVAFGHYNSHTLVAIDNKAAMPVETEIEVSYPLGVFCKRKNLARVNLTTSHPETEIGSGRVAV